MPASCLEYIIWYLFKIFKLSKKSNVTGNKEETDKFLKLLDDKEIPYIKSDLNKISLNEKSNYGKVIISEGRLSEGFESYDLNLIVITGEDLFSTTNTKRRKVSSSFREGEKIVFADLKAGDYVVHKNHGIGQFIGVNTLKADGVIKDYIKLKELENDQFTKKKEKKCLIERIEDDLESRLEFINSDTWRILTTISSVTAMVELKKWKKLVDGLFSRVPFNKWRKLIELGTNDDVEEFLKNI